MIGGEMQRLQPEDFARGLAGLIYVNQLDRQFLEDVVMYALWDAFARGLQEFKRFDYYDTSIEFWAKPGTELCDIDLGCLAVLGFSRCWVCYRENEETEKQCGEKYYSTAELTRASSTPS